MAKKEKSLFTNSHGGKGAAAASTREEIKPFETILILKLPNVRTSVKISK